MSLADIFQFINATKLGPFLLLSFDDHMELAKHAVRVFVNDRGTSRAQKSVASIKLTLPMPVRWKTKNDGSAGTQSRDFDFFKVFNSGVLFFWPFRSRLRDKKNLHIFYILVEKSGQFTYTLK